MNLFPNSESHLIGSNKWGRIALVLIFALALGGCSSNAAREAELATKEAERIAAEQEMARIVQEQERTRVAELQRQREVEVADRARLQAERERQAAEERADEERRRQEEAERREQTRLAQLAVSEALEVERQEKLEQISLLEQQIAEIQIEVDTNEVASTILQETILVAEELLQVLITEQTKYENTDANGNTIDPLSKDLIAELEIRKNNLLRQAQSQ